MNRDIRTGKISSPGLSCMGNYVIGVSLNRPHTSESFVQWPVQSNNFSLYYLHHLHIHSEHKMSPGIRKPGLCTQNIPIHITVHICFKILEKTAQYNNSNYPGSQKY